jgi:hypothetical protein
MSSVDERVAFTVLGYNVHGSTVPFDVATVVGVVAVVSVVAAGALVVGVTGRVVGVVVLAAAVVLVGGGPAGGRGPGAGGRVGGAALAGLACATPPRTVAPNTPALRKYNICRRLTSLGFDGPPW